MNTLMKFDRMVSRKAWYVRSLRPGVLILVKTSKWEPNNYLVHNPAALLRTFREAHYPVGIKFE